MPSARTPRLPNSLENLRFGWGFKPRVKREWRGGATLYTPAEPRVPVLGTSAGTIGRGPYNSRRLVTYSSNPRNGMPIRTRSDRRYRDEGRRFVARSRGHLLSARNSELEVADSHTATISMGSHVSSSSPSSLISRLPSIFYSSRDHRRAYTAKYRQ